MKIMVCYDETKDTRLLDVAKQHAKAFDANVYVAHVMVGSDVGQLDNLDEAKRNIESAQTYLQDDNIHTDTKLIFADQSAGDSLLDYAKENEIDAIIISTRKKSKLGKLIFGSTVQQVILEADCPVIVAK